MEQDPNQINKSLNDRACDALAKIAHIEDMLDLCSLQIEALQAEAQEASEPDIDR